MLRRLKFNMKIDTSVKIGKITMKNPIMPASGTFGEELAEFIDFSELGAMVPKSVTRHAREGNKPPRVVETTSGMLNAVGIQNDGIEKFLENKLSFYSKYNSPLIMSISGHSVQEFCQMVELIENHKEVDGIELNISCPNLKVGGESFGMSIKDTTEIVREVRKRSSKMIIVKLTPNVGDIAALALASEKAGADAVTVANTFTAMAIDIDTRKPILGNVTGGLSGPAIKPVVIRMVWEVAKVINIPIIGVGGIRNYQDVVEYMLAGATAVQVGTASFVDPDIMVNIINDLEKYMIDKNIDKISDLISGLIEENKNLICN
jgi:dihydroorotate dehydrogenase (NAD+) catalytic subunit